MLPSILDTSVTNYQRAIYRFHTVPDLIPIGAYLSSMEIIADEAVGTACTDCQRVIKYCPSYFNTVLSVEMCTSAFIHEVLHKHLRFFQRFERWVTQHEGQYSRGYLLNIFNQAQDYFINWMIKHQWNLPLGDGWLYEYEYNPTDYTTEKIANKLLREHAMPTNDKEGGTPDDDTTGGEGEAGGDDQQQGDDDDADEDGGEGEGGNGGEGSVAGGGDDIILPDMYEGDINNRPSPEQLRDMDAEARQDAANALRVAKGAGTGQSSDPFSEDANDSIYTPKFNFKQELRRFANKVCKKGAYTWFKPNRRLRTNQGIPLPTRHGKRIGTCVFCIDSSGSTSGAEVRFFIDNTVQALRQLDYEKAVIIWCSDGVPTGEGVQEFSKREVEAKGADIWDGLIRKCGGGTHFYPAFEKIAELYPDARCISYLTDGGVGDYEAPEVRRVMDEGGIGNVPVLWLVTNDGWDYYVDKWIANCKKYNLGKVIPLDMTEEEKAA